MPKDNKKPRKPSKPIKEGMGSGIIRSLLGSILKPKK